VLWSSSLQGAAGGVRVLAADVRSGEVQWQRDFVDIAIPGGVAVQGELVFTTSPLAALDLATGATRWLAEDMPGASGTPALSADGAVLYAGRLDPALGGEVLALDAQTGAILWRTPLGNDTLSLLERPWLSDDALVIPTLGGGIVGLDAGTGALRWVAALPALRFGSILVERGRIFTGLQDGQMVVLSAGDGRVLARRGDREGGLETYSFAQRPELQGGIVVMSFGSSLRGYSLDGVNP
jgi:hypothetical protein